MKRYLLLSAGCCFLVLCAAKPATADTVKLNWEASGISDKAGYYMPRRLTLSAEKPAGIKAVPSDLAAPLYGTLTLGPSNAPANYYVILDEPDGKPSRLFVDGNANGDLTDDPPAEWSVAQRQKTSDGKELAVYAGGANLEINYGGEKMKEHMAMYRFDKNDPQRAALTNTLFYYRDYGRAGDISLGGKTYHALLLNDLAGGDFRAKIDANKSASVLFLDLNNDGKFERGESFDVAKPFNIGGTTYEIADLTASGDSFQIVKSSQTVEETKPRASLAAGQPALAFEAKTTDGATVHFPGDYKGKVVLLDFWATWCPPCRAEIPHVADAYEKYHAKGFDILAVSLDKPGDGAKLAEFTKANRMAWPEIYDGQYWSAAVAKKYNIESIPHAFLVDGDTGAIVAEGDSIRGDDLAPTIEKALAKRPQSGG